MGSKIVDQIGTDGALLHDVDTVLSAARKNALILDALPGATLDMLVAKRVVRFTNQVILTAQVTHLGNPWPAFKKRIQIPKSWVSVHRQATGANLTTRFVGIYHYNQVTIFVDFEPSTYVRRKANNSAAHVATNDLYQAQTQGVFSRTDRNGNRLTSVRADLFADYLLGAGAPSTPRIDIFARLNVELASEGRIEAINAVKEMHAASWPDKFQTEWAGFYLEYRLNAFVRREGLTGLVEFQRVKRTGQLDYDLVFKRRGAPEFYGDLKASNVTSRESPGNDAADIKACVDQFGRFWYVIYEHQTWHARHNNNTATMAWNRWRHSVGHNSIKGYNELSYAAKFKEAVRFVGVKILEVNQANFQVVLGEFAQGAQQSGADRALKVMIKKKNIDNFLIYSKTV